MPEPVTVREGDQLVTLEERLATMERSIRRLTWLVLGFIALSILHSIVGPETFQRIIQQALEVVT